MKITTLVENYLYEEKNERLKPQHGLSLYIELENKVILFDAGKDDLFYENSKILGKDIEKVDYLVLSHAHYDHVGGLEKFLGINKKAKIIVNKNVTEKVYSKRLGNYKYIGIPINLVLENLGRFIFVEEEYKLDEKINFIINKNHIGDSLKGNSHLYKKVESEYKLDDFDHELIMVIEEEKDKLVVFTGCSHSGVLNMVKSVEDKYPEKSIIGLVGGFHLQDNVTKKLIEPVERVEDLGNKLKKIPQIYTGHCTGKEGFRVLQKILGDQIKEFHTGKIFKL
ncbi:MAG: MBL fold metallo-hydrolase [Fusobacteria bacterium]|nr:MAG: MBL fold metallo-hydrolase [Fusobacteriota bacterium]